MKEEIKEKKISSTILYTNRKIQVLFFLGSMLILFIVYFEIKQQSNRRFKIIEDDFSWVYQIDSVEEANGKIVFSGFAFKLKQDAKEEAFELILCDTETKKGYYPKMNYSDRDDVNNYFLCEYDYTKSGFIAKISSKRIDKENKIYEVLLRPMGSKKAFTLGIYYANGELIFENPNNYIALDVKGTDLECIVQNGVLCVYRPDLGVYVYQYKDEIYWIMEEWYDFKNNDTYISFHMTTTQVEKLPQNRIDNELFFDDHSFRFSSNEILEWNTGKYRVAKSSLSKEYSIVKIVTGKQSSDWIWYETFRPRYLFE